MPEDEPDAISEEPGIPGILAPGPAAGAPGGGVAPESPDGGALASANISEVAEADAASALGVDSPTV